MNVLPLLLAFLIASAARAEEPLFPFVISFDSPTNVTNLSDWLERPAGRHGFVRAHAGRLATDAGPIRFWATNLCFEACFPSRAEAERLAARLARLGINCVRLHHMDAHAIWGDSPNKLTIDPKKLDRLDYLIHQLKNHGIYVNINLHVSRWLDEPEGFPGRDGRPNYDKGLGNFEPRMIELQKKFARDLLTHVNPYTGTPYTDEPAVAMVEISNEDALFDVWSRNQLDRLPEPYATTYRALWNRWLKAKYGSTDRLLAAWNVQDRPPGPEMLQNGDFAKPSSVGWRMERDDQTRVEWSVRPDGPGGANCLRIEVSRSGNVEWLPQLTQGGLSLKRGEPYTLSFHLRAGDPRRLSVNCMMAHEPWKQLGLTAEVSAETEWRRHEITFFADADDHNARVTFTGFEPGVYELSRVSLRAGGAIGPRKDQTLEDETVPVVRRGAPDVPESARRDFIDFLWDTEAAYWHGLYRFLKQDLGVKSLVSGTQLSYSPPSIQAELDYIDAHAYFHHPHFPGRPWDPRNWTVRNVAMVNEPGGTLVGLAGRRIAGLPYTVSEYNHPAPNEYAAEAFPMIAAFGAFQGWDGVFSFAYSHNTDFEPQRITSFFDIKSDTAKLAHAPACAAMFLRGDVAPANRRVVVDVSVADQKERLLATSTPWSLTASGFGLDPTVALITSVAMRLENSPRDAADLVDAADIRRAEADSKVFVADTGQIRWDLSNPDASYFTVDSPRTKLFTGFVGRREFQLGDVRLSIGTTRLDWATVSMVAIDGDDFTRPGRILVAATGVVRNQGARLKRLDGDDVTLGDRWGAGPVLCEGIPAQIVLPLPAHRVRCFALDESGERTKPVEVTSRDGRACLILDPRYKTVWYEIDIR